MTDSTVTLPRPRNAEKKKQKAGEKKKVREVSATPGLEKNKKIIKITNTSSGLIGDADDDDSDDAMMML